MTMQIEELKSQVKNNNGAASILTQFMENGDIIQDQEGSFHMAKEGSPIKDGSESQMNEMND